MLKRAQHDEEVGIPWGPFALSYIGAAWHVRFMVSFRLDRFDCSATPQGDSTEALEFLLWTVSHVSTLPVTLRGLSDRIADA